RDVSRSQSLLMSAYCSLSFFFQAEDGIRDPLVTGVQTCALPISAWTTFTTYFSTQLTTLQDLSRATWASFSSGVGSAVAQSIVFGQSLGESFSKLLQNIAAMVIQTLVEMALQAVISHTLAAAAATTRATV